MLFGTRGPLGGYYLYNKVVNKIKIQANFYKTFSKHLVYSVINIIFIHNKNAVF